MDWISLQKFVYDLKTVSNAFLLASLHICTTKGWPTEAVIVLSRLWPKVETKCWTNYYSDTPEAVSCDRSMISCIPGEDCFYSHHGVYQHSLELSSD